MVASPPKLNGVYSPDSSSLYSPPPINFIKLSFDGASKGNLGPVGFGGILRNDKSEPLCIYTMDYGFSSNNNTRVNVVIQLPHFYGKAGHKQDKGR